ncbi:MAG: phytanoyl-CoA dioxygenase family protein [Lewinellaceae bacterium]|nr:phytanoyl-CoA dioxygenase family protein [Lewinellaceae bacterium]
MKPLSPTQIDHFIIRGYVKLESAFSAETAEACRNILWKATQCDPHDPGTWTKPVIRIGELGLEPFRQAANTPELHGAFDQLVGAGVWQPKQTLGSFPIRFPSDEPPGDTGWHVDASFPGAEPDNYFEWRINFRSKGRALLMLFLFSDVSEPDAPTRIKAGSHLDVAKILAPEGENGLSFMELAQKLDALPECEEVLATGKAGTVYLCHPFIVHAAQPHRGKNPKFMAQPPLHTRIDFDIEQPEQTANPVERAIMMGLNR